MKRFVDRIEELSALDEEYRRPEASLVVVYGRRRVGKTELLSEFIKGKRALYFLATEESIVENRNSFRLAVAEFTQQGLLRSGNQFSWDVLFEQTAQAGTMRRSSSSWMNSSISGKQRKRSPPFCSGHGIPSSGIKG